MAPSAKNRWDEEEEDSSTPPSSPPPPALARRGKFDDEEDEDDVLDSWDAAEDSDEEREKAKKAAEAKAKAEAEAKANKKSKSQRIEEHRMAKMRQRQEDADDSDESEDEYSKMQRLRQQEKEADLKNAEDLFGGAGGVSNNRKVAPKAVLADPNDPTSAINLSDLKLFTPDTLSQFVALRETLIPLIVANAKKAQYSSFAQEFSRQLVKDLPSDQIKKIASSMTTLSNEKMKEEKAADKGPKKSKAAKTKTTLNASRDTTLKADTNNYDEEFGLDDGDFM